MTSVGNSDRFTMKRRNRATNFTLHVRDTSLVSAIAVWIHNSGVALGVNGHVIYWLANISILCYITTIILQLITMIEAKNDIAKIFEDFGVISFSSMGLLKLYSLRANLKDWYSLLSTASDLEIQQLNSDDPSNLDYESDDEDDIFQKNITKYTHKFTWTCSWVKKIYAATCIMYISSPFIEYAIGQIQGAEALEYPHIFPVRRLLEDDTYFLAYIISILVEMIAGFYCVLVHTVFDLTVVGMMIFIQGQFLLLRESCEHIGGNGQRCNLSRERDSRAHFRITRCQRIHTILIKSVNELRKLTRNTLGYCFNVATLTLCSVAIQLVSNELSTTQIFTLLQYLCAMSLQLFLFCYYGDDVMSESSVMLGEGPSASAWWCLSPHIRREVALLYVSMSRQCRLLAGPFHEVNLAAFIQIVRTTYSYYAVIRQKSDK